MALLSCVTILQLPYFISKIGSLLVVHHVTDVSISNGLIASLVYDIEIFGLESTQRFQKLIYSHLPTDCFMKISLHSTIIILIFTTNLSQTKGLYYLTCKYAAIFWNHTNSLSA